MKPTPKEIDTDDRYISVEQSIINACKEVKLMMEGRLPEHTLDELWQRMDAMEDEAKLEEETERRLKVG